MVTTEHNDLPGMWRAPQRLGLAVILVAVLALVTATGTAGAAHSITSCADDVTNQGRHTVDSDITDATSPACINVTASDVILEGNDNTADGVNQTSGSIGVDVEGSTALTNVTVRNLTVTNWSDGVRYEAVDDGEITDVNARRNFNGISTFLRGNTDITDNKATGNDVRGIFIQSSGNNVTSNIATGNNNTGISLIGSSGNNVTNNNVSGNDVNGFFLSASNNNTLMGNDASGNDRGIDLFLSNDNNDFINNTARNNFVDFRTVDSSNNTVENLDIGASTAPNTTLDFTGNNVSLSGESMPPADPSGKQNIGRFVDATNTSSSGSFLNLTFEYEDSDVSGVNETTLDVWKNNGTWTELGAGPATDPAANEIQFNITDFGSVFAPLANTGVGAGPGVGEECINRRDLSRGQEDQECPRDRELGRGESRRDLDRSTGRRSDTSRRDRGGGSRSRGR